MHINPNVFGWIKLLVFGFGAYYLWRSAIKPKGNEPRGMGSRSIRVVGALILSAVTLYFLGYGLGLYGLSGTK